MYIALEGIKGTGKSTIIGHLNDTNKRLCVFPFTKEIPVGNPFEQICVSSPYLKTNDAFCEQLYAERAKWHHNHAATFGTLLGDRSIITAYVTRWNKWGDPYLTIARSEKLHNGIRHPDVIVLLQPDPEKSLERIQQRPIKTFGRYDEQLWKLKEAAEIYEELLIGRLYMKKVSKAQMIKVPASVPMEELTIELQSILNYYNK